MTTAASRGATIQYQGDVDSPPQLTVATGVFVVDEA